MKLKFEKLNTIKEVFKEVNAKWGRRWHVSCPSCGHSFIPTQKVDKKIKR